MKQYSIFLIENGHEYPLYEKDGKYWLGGNKLNNLLFTSKSKAEEVARKIRATKHPAYNFGKIVVSKCEIIRLLD